MGKFWSNDNFLMKLLGTVADLAIINVVTLIFCMPIVTIGPSLTACYYATLKAKRGEGKLIKNFWRSFKENFWKSMILFFVFLLLGVVIFFVGNVVLRGENESIQAFLKGIYIIVLCEYVGALVWVFAIHSRFEHSIAMTIKKALIISIRYIPRTVVMVAFWMVPLYIFIYCSFKWHCLLFVFGISMPVYVSVQLYNKIFEMYEEVMNQSKVKSESDEVMS